MILSGNPNFLQGLFAISGQNQQNLNFRGQQEILPLVRFTFSSYRKSGCTA